MRLFFLSTLFFALSALSFEHMPSLPDGRYLGHGHFSDNLGEEIDYQTYTQISGNLIHSDYAWDDGDISLTLAFWWQGDGYFTVAYNDYIIGDGRCMAFSCEFDLTFDNAQIHETYFFLGRYFLRVGHKVSDDYTVRWEEKLRLLDLNENGEELPGSEIDPGTEAPVVSLPVETP